MYKKYFKRIIDFLVALVVFVIVLPILLIITILLFFVNKGTPFFFQIRPGLNGKLFKIIKFKTMNDKCDEQGVLLLDEKRLSKIGIFIRKTSLDELPQLLNVLKGEMSLIGPRPLLPEYLPLYSQEQKKRHAVKPGITGWAQVNGRNSMLFSERFKHDVWYVNNLSFITDIKIIFLTLKKVFVSEGVISGQDVHDVDDLGFNK